VEERRRRRRIRRLTRVASSAATHTVNASPSRPWTVVPKPTRAQRTPFTCSSWSSASAPCTGPSTGISTRTWSAPKIRGFTCTPNPSQKPSSLQWRIRAHTAVRFRPTRRPISAVENRGSVPHQEYVPPGYIHRKMRRSMSSTWTACSIELKPAAAQIVARGPGRRFASATAPGR